MSVFYQSSRVTVLADERGFIEWIVAEEEVVTIEEIRQVASLLAEQRPPCRRVLVNRRNRYVHSEDYLVANLEDVEGLQVVRLAFYAPRTRDQIFSQVVSSAAFRRVPCRVFSGRDEAVEWLLGGD